jgi:GTPase SAR1 family protein
MDVSKFDFSKFPHNSINVIIIGKRATGKSTLVNDLLNFKNLNNGIIIAPVVLQFPHGSGNQLDYSKFSDIFNEYKPEIIDNFLKRQKLKIKNKNEDVYSYLVLDNCFYDNAINNDPNFMSLMVNNRQFKLDLITTMSYPLSLSPTFRSNIDCVFILKDKYLPNRKRIYEHYGGIFDSFELFDQYLTKLTENPYNCMVICNFGKTNDIKDNVYWYCVNHDI